MAALQLVLQRCGARYERDGYDVWTVPGRSVNRKDGAVLARYDHVVSKCAHMVERNPGVVRERASETIANGVRTPPENL